MNMNNMGSIKIRQGDDFEGAIVFKDPITKLPKDLTGSILKMQFRNSLISEFIEVVATNISLGQFRYHAPNSQTLDWREGMYELWIIEETSDGKIHSTIVAQLWVEV